jgi:ATP-dependent Clp protease ATP-binding subunit ClpB
MTSNIGAQHLLEGITADGEIEERARDRVLAEMRSHFRPEFLNRVDEIVLFKPLRREEIERIVDLLVEQLRQRLAERRIALEITPAAKAHVAERGYDPVYGARPLKRLLQREVETKVGRELLTGEVAEGSTMVVDAVGGEIRVRLERPAPEAAKAR